MGLPLAQQIKVGAYVAKHRIMGKRRYPLVLMLEPLFRCNLACAGCGKIDYPETILSKRLGVEACVAAVDECGAPVVSIAGGEPLLHPQIDEIVSGVVARRKYVYLCTNGLLLQKKLDLLRPSRFLTFSVHLDGLREDHDRSVCQDGVFARAVQAIGAAKARGFRVGVNCTLFNDAQAPRVRQFFDFCRDMGIDGITVSPGYAYERAPDQKHFLNRRQTKDLFRDILRDLKTRKWPLAQSILFLDFLAGNQSYRCTPWSNPTRNVFGWQRPCYLLGEGYASSFKDLMEATPWDEYGTGRYEKCADCMVHCGYEGTAVEDAVRHPLKALRIKLRGIKVEGERAPEILLDRQRPARHVFERNVAEILDGQDLLEREPGTKSIGSVT
jgi:hopanoid biosynthesis associated radical SAM protein HpnH